MLHMLHDIASGMKYLTDKGYIHTVNITPKLYDKIAFFCGKPLLQGHIYGRGALRLGLLWT